MYAHKRIISVTLDIECYDDLNLEDINWNDILGLEGDENVDISIRETADVYQCASRGSGTLYEHKTPKSCIVEGSKKFTSKMINNDTLEMLSAREQLMEDIIAIVDEYFQAQINECDDMGELSNFEEAKDDLTNVLCDAVCKNFPVK